MAIKTAFFVILLLTIIVGVTLCVIPCENSIVEETSETYFGSQVLDENNYDPYYQESNNLELEPVKVYQKYKNEGITNVVKIVECNGNCNGKSYD